MRCFLACFGFPIKRKKCKSVFSPDEAQGSYLPLATFLEENDGHLGVVGDPRSKHSVPSSVRLRGGRPSLTRKKVRFDLNVQAYELIPPEDSFSPENDAEKIVEKKHCEEMTPMVGSTGGSAFPSNYRYQNCRDSSDEEDGFLFDDGDLEFEHDENEYFGDDENCEDSHQLEWRSRNDDMAVRSDTVCMSSEERSSLTKLVEDSKNSPVLPLSASTNLQELCTTIRSSENARFRNHYVHSVLNPIENTVQWKMVKAKAKLPNRKPNEENRELEGQLPVPPTSSKPSERASTSCKSYSRVHHAPVNASLSSWLVPVEH